MYLFKQLIEWVANDTTPQIGYSRQYRLIKTVSVELIILGLFLIYIYSSWHLWRLVYLVTGACVIAALNLIILKKNKNSIFCGHVLTLLVLISTTLANCWMGGIATSYFGWFYVVPILAAAVIGWSGLLIYASIALFMVIFFTTQTVIPVYELANADFLLMGFINRFFSLFVITTTLYTVLRENAQYEKMLRDHNYLLQADKDKFHYLARYDTLTNLPNRSYFNAYLQNVLDSAKIKGHCVTVFFMDFDGLKEVNDHYGHEAGDILLAEGGNRMQACLRENDFLARLGGDEFTAVVNHLEKDKIPKSIAQRIIEEFNRPFVIGGREIHCKISIGLASYPHDTRNADALIAKADKAMYAAKNLGGNTYRKNKRTKKIFYKEFSIPRSKN
ncbi:GGDEF/EAL domain-containing sensory box protein [Legionella nautarum]|uniref:GGDEF/EAL domain-containing sensory box protein n=1 Tax=Legionella nautarum TaxID=45070 RepID=A0A0W0X2Q5_9GAMM|nr:diguanylate cyclase [Legionella nautarum]KTD38867.1 GGDEF/EAL domain-containing sensory box protein [Legionella nautarum]